MRNYRFKTVAKSLKEFIALAKTTPGKINYASAGGGRGNHLSQELFKFMAGIGMKPTGGPPERVSELLKREIAKWQKVVKVGNIKPEN